MRKTVFSLLFVVFILFSSTVSATTSTTIEFFSVKDKNSDIVLSADIFSSGKFGKNEDSKWGWSAFFLVTKGWAQGYTGITYSPLSWLKVGLSGGIEQISDDEIGFRSAVSLRLGNNKISFLGIFEFSPSLFEGEDVSIWYDLTGKFNATDWLSLGIKFRRFTGLGPVVSLHTPKFLGISTTLWGMWAPLNPELGFSEGLQPSKFLLGIKGKF